MKQLLFLLLFPCLALAQYQGNANQKITLGEQTTADGLVYRGVAYIDTVTATSKITRANKQDTSAYILLDTVTNLLWHYKIGSNAWTQAGGSVTSVAALTLGTTGTNLSSSVATGTTTPVITLNVPDASETARGVISTGDQTITGIKTFRSLKIKNTGNYAYFDIANSTANFGGGLIRALQNNNISGGFGVQGAFFGDASKNLLFYSETDLDLIFATVPSTTNEPTTRMTIRPLGNVGIGTTGPQEKLHVVGNARITGAYDVTTGSASNVFVTTDGVLQRSTSSIKYKTDVEDYSKGLKELMQLRPVTFKSINSNNDKTYAGFIAEELADLKLNELVENNDSGEPDAISYAYMVTLLTKAIQEQQEQISQLKKRLFILENK